MNIKIPKEFQVTPFYEKSTIELPQSVTSFKGICQALPFYYDITGNVRPWEQKHEFLPMLFQWWSEEEGELAKCYEQRNPQAAKEMMRTMIAVFIDSLFWLNERPVNGVDNFHHQVSGLTYKPVNCSERLNYLLLEPNRYHTFVQLKALFSELRKLYAKVKVIEKRK
ncbi:YpoC family protein [Halalkalibacter kiskunsagensis]|uniref:YpoC family protein n=1 Tax=Halalkalibacter kiskunsagensis TaxID=1548599 RepID=A0ABV6KBD7_9BACI